MQLLQLSAHFSQVPSAKKCPSKQVRQEEMLLDLQVAQLLRQGMHLKEFAAAGL